MGILKPATNKMAYGKVGIYGGAGAGKTFTACLIAIGLHKKSGSKKPIAVFDTEPAFSFVLPLFRKGHPATCLEEDIDVLIVDDNRSLSGLLEFMQEAETVCDIAIIDSITHVWRDAQESYITKINRFLASKKKRPISQLEFHHWRPIKAAWGEFTDKYLSCKMHVVLCGRAGNVYMYQKNEETGKQELVTDGTRMATEKELGHEPSLLLEMVEKHVQGEHVNVACIIKDRSDTINGMEFEKPKFEDFEPFFESLNLGGVHFDSMETKDSTEMFDGDTGTDSWNFELRQRTVWYEEIIGLLEKHHPGMTGDAKKARMEIIDGTFHTRSLTKVENMPSDILKLGCEEIRFKLEPPLVEEDDGPDETRDIPESRLDLVGGDDAIKDGGTPSTDAGTACGG